MSRDALSVHLRVVRQKSLKRSDGMNEPRFGKPGKPEVIGHVFKLLFCAGASWFLTLKRWHSPVPRTLDVAVIALIIFAIIYLPNILRGPQKAFLLVLVGSAWVAAFRYNALVADHYLPFVSCLVVVVALPRRPLAEPMRKAWHRLKNSPHEERARFEEFMKSRQHPK